ncbi:MAG: hypothetical protein J7578_05440 [Chitinophagaceae bacterium]|nr:hypothetical protein [Chitinophagaceae bacterium]
MGNLAIPPTISLKPELQAGLIESFRAFFNGDVLGTVRNDLQLVFDTTITESYGELDAEDKYMVVDFFRRIGTLIEWADKVLESTDEERAGDAEDNGSDEDNDV